MVKRLFLDDDDAEPKTKGQRFQKGKAKTGGREKGVPNKTTALLKEAIIIAAELEGIDRNGKDGLVGFLRKASRKDLRSYLRMMEKLLPYQLTGKDGSPMQIVHTSKAQLIERMKERGMPLPQSLLEMPTHSDVKN